MLKLWYLPIWNIFTFNRMLRAVWREINETSVANRTLPRIRYLEKRGGYIQNAPRWNHSRNLSLPPIISQRRHNNESQVSMKAKRERKKEKETIAGEAEKRSWGPASRMVSLLSIVGDRTSANERRRDFSSSFLLLLHFLLLLLLPPLTAFHVAQYGS